MLAQKTGRNFRGDFAFKRFAHNRGFARAARHHDDLTRFQDRGDAHRDCAHRHVFQTVKVAGGIGALVAMRFGVGVGEAGFAPGGTALVSASYPDSKRARVLGIFNLFITIGVIVVVVGGGVSANRGLRAALEAFRVPVHFPPMRYCTDNAAMTAGLADVLLREGRTAGLDLDAITSSAIR